MKRLLAAFALLAAWLVPGVASAHPLGNFTVNHYARLEPAGDRVRIAYVLDMAEIPTFQEKPRIDANPDAYAAQRAEEIRQHLQLTLNGVATPLVLEQHALSLPDGAGGLPTLRLEATYAASVPGDAGATVDLVFRDDNDPTRIGWREIIARPGAVGTAIEHTSVPTQDTTNELRQYPDDLLNSPLSVRDARLSFIAGAAASQPKLSVSATGAAPQPMLSVSATGAAPQPMLSVSATGAAETGASSQPMLSVSATGASSQPMLSVSATGAAPQPMLSVSATGAAETGAASQPMLSVSATGASSQPMLSVSATGAASQPRLSVSATGAGLLDNTRSAFAELANGAELTPAFILFAIGVAIVLGAAHALQPGHGKTVVAAYLVGSRGTARHALFLGGTVTATHTAGVYALGLVTLFLSQYILPERLYPILEIASGLLVVGIGAWLFGQRLLSALGFRRQHDHGHAHGGAERHADDEKRHTQGEKRHGQGQERHADDDKRHADGEERHAQGQERHTHGQERHTHDDERHVQGPERHAHDDERHMQGQERHADDEGRHTHGGTAHSHAMPERVGWKSLLALGVSGGLLPCPEALMVLLITIAAHRVLFGLLLIVSFSTGLAAVLIGFGLLLVYARGFFSRVNLNSGLVSRLLPVASALVIVIAGGVITAQALPQVL